MNNKKEIEFKAEKEKLRKEILKNYKITSSSYKIGEPIDIKLRSRIDILMFILKIKWYIFKVRVIRKIKYYLLRHNFIERNT